VKSQQEERKREKEREIPFLFLFVVVFERERRKGGQFVVKKTLSLSLSRPSLPEEKE
jgi:hypothetical protein